MGWASAIKKPAYLVLGTVCFATSFASAPDSLAAVEGPSLASWGHNFFEQSANDSYYDAPYPTYVPGLKNLRSVSAGFYQSLALDLEGNVWHWGGTRTLYARMPAAYADFRYSGIESWSFDMALDYVDREPDLRASSPHIVGGLSGVVAISSGGFHNLALKSDGTVWAWGGGNSVGTLGDGSGVDRPTPVQVSGLTDVVSVSAGFAHSLAVTRDGSVWVWGWNGWGQLGLGGSANEYIPVRLPGMLGFTSVSAGAFHSLALNSNGSVWGWGSSQFGAVGTGQGGIVHWTPITVYQGTGLTGITAISAGGYHSLALRSDGRVFSWGYGELGQNGNGNNSNAYYPAIQNGLFNINSISAGLYHNLATSTDGLIWGWGNNMDGQLGRGTLLNTSSSQWPVSSSLQSVPGLASWYLTGASAIAAGGYHSVALLPPPPSTACDAGTIIVNEGADDLYHSTVAYVSSNPGSHTICLRVSAGGAVIGGALSIADTAISSPATWKVSSSQQPCRLYNFTQRLSNIARLDISYGNPTAICIQLGSAWTSITIELDASIGKVTWAPDQA